ncbi:glycerate dehydrogenase [Salipiger pallidus]|uniref:Glycerate dehydrogenase n=1 Tax=Salipiger pallidus TaxID=1775170 RepID=A0A8J2ZJR8_9RHOB|nr:2-hydroxyacid dehydrogenase [Salipiger pallidus]GGG72243.1 glycerate dehydrogenase [Salipiger pallidus]
MTRPLLYLPRAFPTSEGRVNGYELLGPDDTGRDTEVRAIALSGPSKVDTAVMDRFPKLEIVAKFGVGYDSIDVAAAQARGVAVTNTPDVLTEEVADLAVGLLIATSRQLPQADSYLRAGHWTTKPYPLTHSLRGRRIGILGLGRIGLAIAERLTAMKLEVAYATRTPRDVPYAYHPDALSLAQACDALVVIVPGGAATEGLVSAKVLDALGPDGILVNVARGSVVDETALIAALASGRLGAAGLDVFEHEPQMPQALIELPNTVLLPHVGSATEVTRRMMGDRVLDNLDAWFRGDRVPDQVA